MEINEKGLTLFRYRTRITNYIKFIMTRNMELSIILK